MGRRGKFIPFTSWFMSNWIWKKQPKNCRSAPRLTKPGHYLWHNANIQHSVTLQGWLTFILEKIICIYCVDSKNKKWCKVKVAPSPWHLTTVSASLKGHWWLGWHMRWVSKWRNQRTSLKNFVQMIIPFGGHRNVSKQFKIIKVLSNYSEF